MRRTAEAEAELDHSAAGADDRRAELGAEPAHVRRVTRFPRGRRLPRVPRFPLVGLAPLSERRWLLAAGALAVAVVACAWLVTVPEASAARLVAGARQSSPAEGSSDFTQVLVAEIDGAVTKVNADYLSRAIALAEAEGHPLVLTLNTPGGDTGSMRRMAEAMQAASQPVLVWVGPRGAQAASAGTFLVLAAHGAGMAPRTTIGAASPVGAEGQDLPETMRDKVTNDLAAQARGLAARRGEAAAEWAEAAVTDARSATESEALELGVIDAVADSPAALVEAMDGLEIEVDGAKQVIEAPPSPPRETAIARTRGEQLLGLLAQPAVALLLLTLGVNAILIELSNPGGFVAGIVGLTALALGFYSLGVLEANLVGLAFMAGAVAMFVLELKSPSTGFFALAGLGLFIAGGAVLFSGTTMGVPWVVLLVTAGFTALLVILALGAIVRVHKRRPASGFEGLIGTVAMVREPLAPAGTVLAAGELWEARLAAPVKPAGDSADADAGAAADAEGASGLVGAGERVRIVGRRGFELRVRKLERGEF